MSKKKNKKRTKYGKKNARKIWRKGSKQIKAQLFLRCGRVDMYNMQEYAKEKLTLHHFPPVRLSHHTVYEECYLLCEENHRELHRLEFNDYAEYERRMQVIIENKKILERARKHL